MERIAFTVVVAALATGATAQDVVTAPASVAGPAPIGAFSFANTIDQSGLTVNYTSGVTDFATYAAALPRHHASNGPENYAATFGVAPRLVDYTLPSATTLTRVAFWQYPFASAGPIEQLDVYAGLLSDFSDAVLVGSFSLIKDGTGLDAPGTGLQVLDTANIHAQYVRFDAVRIDAASTGWGWSEVAFGTIPTPGATVTLAMVAIGAARRRR